MSDRNPWHHFLDDAGDAWPMAEFLAKSPGDDDEVVVLDGRELPAARLVEVWRWLFDK